MCMKVRFYLWNKYIFKQEQFSCLGWPQWDLSKASQPDAVHESSHVNSIDVTQVEVSTTAFYLSIKVMVLKQKYKR